MTKSVGTPLVLRLGLSRRGGRPARPAKPGWVAGFGRVQTGGRERSTIPDAIATVHDAMLGVDEVIARAPTAVEVSARCNGLGQQAVYPVTGPRRCGRLPAWPPGGSRPLPALEAAARPTWSGRQPGGRARA